LLLDPVAAVEYVKLHYYYHYGPASSTGKRVEVGTSPDELTADQQTAILAERYSSRADAYDALWSPVIRPAGERLIGHLPLSRAKKIVDVGTGSGALLPLIQKASPSAVVLGVDNSEGMLRLAKDKHPGPLALMDVQRLELDDNQFDVAVVAFVLFHLPRPEWCVAEVNRVLRPGGVVGTVTWGAEHIPPAEAIWDEELEASGAHVVGLPAADNRACCDSPEKVAALLSRAGFGSTRTWTEPLHHQWRPEDFFEYQLRGGARPRLLSLPPDERDRCVRRVRDRWSGQGEDKFVFSGEVVLATGVKT
jgi:ubiquinone/menaquinone biosynthesis C-methylase UbiE